MSRDGKIENRKIRRQAARGTAVIESIASIVIFTMMLGFVMSITCYLYFQQALVTAAREGARQAALNSDIGDPSSEGSGVSSIETYVENEILALTGQPANGGNVIVTPPSQSSSQTPGQRTVEVEINWQMQNPVGIYNMIDALGGDGEPFRTIPVNARATMRYEE